ncbi:MAG TPA: hypothetical protein VFK56_14200 [Mycobacterium sp.]|nr:hypothetical protein [Mycobacterium sp.]
MAVLSFVTTLVGLHATSVLDIVYMALTQPGPTLTANTVVRLAVVGVFPVVWRAARPHQTPGTKR